MAYSRRGKKKTIPILSDAQGIEITKQYRLKMLADARSLMGR
jgi:hypothetical protein